MTTSNSGKSLSAVLILHDVSKKQFAERILRSAVLFGVDVIYTVDEYLHLAQGLSSDQHEIIARPVIESQALKSELNKKGYYVCGIALSSDTGTDVRTAFDVSKAAEQITPIFNTNRSMNPIALLVGNEGRWNKDSSFCSCDFYVHIDRRPGFPPLDIAQLAELVLYESYYASCRPAVPSINSSLSYPPTNSPAPTTISSSRSSNLDSKGRTRFKLDGITGWNSEWIQRVYPPPHNLDRVEIVTDPGPLPPDDLVTPLYPFPKIDWVGDLVRSTFPHPNNSDGSRQI